jgi:hypothetical protein
MPTIATPPNTGLRDWRREDRPQRPRDSATHPSILLRIRVAARHTALTQQLSEGADPATSAELRVYATRLTGSRRRKTLARTLKRTIVDARCPAVARGGIVPIRRRAIIDAEDALLVLIDRLGDTRAVTAEGMKGWP